MENLTLADYQTYKLGDWHLQSGEVIPDAFIAYKTYGSSELPAIIYPTWYSGSRSTIPQLLLDILSNNM